MIGPLTRLKLRRLPRRGLRLHLGCGTVRLEGWVNIDLETPEADIHLDITRGLPLPDASARLVYHEHLMEHITIDEAIRCLRDWLRLLEPGGVLRIATPDLAYVVERYGADWRNQAWLRLPEYAFIQTPAEMLNTSMRWWGHQYLYDEEELRRRMGDAGFAPIRRCALGESTVPELGRLETREDSRLILEGVRP